MFKLITKKVLIILVLSFSLLAALPLGTAYADTPTGCPGGPAGPPAPGTRCDDGSYPVKDSSLPMFCPGSSQQGAVPNDYKVTCPARPGRPKCVYAVDQSKNTCAQYAPKDPSSEGDNTVCSGDKNADGSCKVPVECEGELSDECGVISLLGRIINIMAGLVGVIVVAVIVLGGIQYSTAGGDSQKVAKARQRISNAVIALFAFIFMWAFLQWVVPGGLL